MLLARARPPIWGIAGCGRGGSQCEFLFEPFSGCVAAAGNEATQPLKGNPNRSIAAPFRLLSSVFVARRPYVEDMIQPDQLDSADPPGGTLGIRACCGPGGRMLTVSHPLPLGNWRSHG